MSFPETISGLFHSVRLFPLLASNQTTVELCQGGAIRIPVAAAIRIPVAATAAVQMVISFPETISGLFHSVRLFPLLASNQTTVELCQGGAIRIPVAAAIRIPVAATAAVGLFVTATRPMDLTLN
uniref:Uncharacterized protein n=1 Tax=Oryza meridionalis TaxID=40149 RepID=A0A0E0C2D5_9ORYZ